MIISHKYKFIFIHIPKCAGTSISYAFEPYLGHKDLLLGGTPKGETKSRIWMQTYGLHKHAGALKIKKYVEKSIWDNYFKFSFVRNPWDLVVSMYYWWLKTQWDDDEKTGEKIRALGSFEEYALSSHLKAFSCSQHVMDKKNTLLVDFIGRYENLDRDFAYICGKTGLPNIYLPVRNKSIHRDYKSQYTKKSMKIIQDRYSRDIKNFSYTYS